MRMLIASFFVAHGLAHLVGFLAPSYDSSFLSDRLGAGVGTVRAMGVLWFLTAMSFVVAAVALATYAPWWMTLTATTAVFSLGLSILEWPRAHLGVYINVAILVGLVVATF